MPELNLSFHYSPIEGEPYVIYTIEQTDSQGLYSEEEKLKPKETARKIRKFQQRGYKIVLQKKEIPQRFKSKIEYLIRELIS